MCTGGPRPRCGGARGPGSPDQGSGDVLIVRLRSLIALPLPSSEILDPLGHPSQQKNGTSHSLLPLWHRMRKNSGSHSFLFPSSPCSVISTLVNGWHFRWQQPFHVSCVPRASCLLHSCYLHVREKAIRRVSLAMIFPF